jgi:hypothetical protein
MSKARRSAPAPQNIWDHVAALEQAMISRVAMRSAVAAAAAQVMVRS